MATTPQRPILDDQSAYGAAWSAASFTDRRRITRAINRGEALEDGREAELAVMAARRQVGFWRWGWLIGPAITLLQIGGDLVVFGISLAMSAVATGTLSWFFLRRARRAETVNIELAERSAAKAAKRSKRTGRTDAAPHPRSQEAASLAASQAAKPSLLQRLRLRG
jgi:hypothetical protein